MIGSDLTLESVFNKAVEEADRESSRFEVNDEQRASNLFEIVDGKAVLKLTDHDKYLFKAQLEIAKNDGIYYPISAAAFKSRLGNTIVDTLDRRWIIVSAKSVDAINCTYIDLISPCGTFSSNISLDFDMKTGTVCSVDLAR
jgi:hypothetical protein